ncbi:Sulphur transport [Cribrihabitans marinus]|uniref:Sulphur transport n=1 Tax=Cribrihabitans marinus TaxID=1227549 RepID=A0A1H6V6Z9_9RHOB|nr:YeeE/YedE family protein [Cribrihabitans marinus]GGH26863.1 lipocalin [Cribrihabitans marinus]SEI96062.1 Sulphur transport [Cribrihabitans marinus]
MLEALIDRFGDPAVMCAAGVFVGLLFGAAALHSKFCLRAATVEVSEGQPGPRLAIWLVAFFAALVTVQATILTGALDTSDARQLAATGSLSGAIIGGLMFGAGMILARGCVSRLLVLSATGNLRAIVTGLVVTIVAQAALSGVLSPLRETLALLWTVPGGSARSVMGMLGMGVPVLTTFAALAFVGALVFGRVHRVPVTELAAATLVGVAVFVGWLVTYLIAQVSFEVIAVQSVTFTGPSTDTLMALVTAPDVIPSFGLGLVPGVFIGALLTALIKGEARVQRFDADTPMERYLVGGVLMGFGSMLAGGCAVGAGMAGGSIMALTAWVAVFCMWVGAMITHRWMSSRPQLVQSA